MVVGMAVIGWFVAVPQAKVVVSGDAASGAYSVQAAPGLGYAYRWDGNGDGTFDSEEFSSNANLTLNLEEGASQEVKLEVKNAFGRTRTGVYQITRPRRDGTIALLEPSAPAVAATLTTKQRRDAASPIRGIH
jgi:hypothetical protein